MGFALLGGLGALVLFATTLLVARRAGRFDHRWGAVPELQAIHGDGAYRSASLSRWRRAAAPWSALVTSWLSVLFAFAVVPAALVAAIVTFVALALGGAPLSAGVMLAAVPIVTVRTFLTARAALGLLEADVAGVVRAHREVRWQLVTDIALVCGMLVAMGAGGMDGLAIAGLVAAALSFARTATLSLATRAVEARVAVLVVAPRGELVEATHAPA